IPRSNDNQEAIEQSDKYHEVLRGYQPKTDGSIAVQGHAYVPNLEPRISELFWQYELPDTFCEARQPHIYLGILFEDHSRRCVWEVARFYRAMGYSLFNQAHPPTRRFTTICEFVRRGTR